MTSQPTIRFGDMSRRLIEPVTSVGSKLLDRLRMYINSIGGYTTNLLINTYPWSRSSDIDEKHNSTKIDEESLEKHLATCYNSELSYEKMLVCLRFLLLSEMMALRRSTNSFLLANGRLTSTKTPQAQSEELYKLRIMAATKLFMCLSQLNTPKQQSECPLCSFFLQEGIEKMQRCGSIYVVEKSHLDEGNSPFLFRQADDEEKHFFEKIMYLVVPDNTSTSKTPNKQSKYTLWEPNVTGGRIPRKQTAKRVRKKSEATPNKRAKISKTPQSKRKTRRVPKSNTLSKSEKDTTSISQAALELFRSHDCQVLTTDDLVRTDEGEALLRVTNYKTTCLLLDAVKVTGSLIGDNRTVVSEIMNSILIDFGKLIKDPVPDKIDPAIGTDAESEVSVPELYRDIRTELVEGTITPNLSWLIFRAPWSLVDFRSEPPRLVIDDYSLPTFCCNGENPEDARGLPHYDRILQLQSYINLLNEVEENLTKKGRYEEAGAVYAARRLYSVIRITEEVPFAVTFKEAEIKIQKFWAKYRHCTKVSPYMAQSMSIALLIHRSFEHQWEREVVVQIQEKLKEEFKTFMKDKKNSKKNFFSAVTSEFSRSLLTNSLNIEEDGQCVFLETYPSRYYKLLPAEGHTFLDSDGEGSDSDIEISSFVLCTPTDRTARRAARYKKKQQEFRSESVRSGGESDDIDIDDIDDDDVDDVKIDEDKIDDAGLGLVTEPDDGFFVTDNHVIDTDEEIGVSVIGVDNNIITRAVSPSVIEVHDEIVDVDSNVSIMVVGFDDRATDVKSLLDVDGDVVDVEDNFDVDIDNKVVDIETNVDVDIDDKVVEIEEDIEVDIVGTEHVREDRKDGGDEVEGRQVEQTDGEEDTSINVLSSLLSEYYD